MPKFIKLGRFQLETKSALVGLLLAYVGLSIPQTKGIFQKIYETVASLIGGIFKKKMTNKNFVVNGVEYPVIDPK